MDDAELLNALGAVLRPRPDWQQSAACRGINPDVFHPDKDDTRGQKAAKAICAGCPVQADCLRYALDAGEDRGIWGGLSTRERGDLAVTGGIVRLTPGRRVQPCGTNAAYKRHLLRDEPACPACLHAWATRAGRWNAEHRQDTA